MDQPASSSQASANDPRWAGWRTLRATRQWTVQVNDQGEYRVVNPGPNGERQYYQIVAGTYGEPLIEQEPDLALEVPPGFAYEDAAGHRVFPDQRIGGIICKDDSGKVVLRLSLTHAKNKGMKVYLTDQGVLFVDDREFHLGRLVMPDKNRMKGYVGVFYTSSRPDPTRPVPIEELADLV